MPPPLIALTASSRTPARGEAKVGVNDAYVRALQSVGLIPLIIPPSLGPDDARALVARVDGVLLSGGEDVDPVQYGAARHPLTQPAHPGRDATEVAIALAAREAGRPTLAICRGLQLLNVAFGGTLVQDLGTERPGGLAHPRDDARDERVHALSIAPDTRLATIVGAREITVNSLHHQAIDRVALSLRDTAHAPDGVIEAVESTDDWWAVAVQWHPEELMHDAQPWDRAIFAAFAVVCSGRRSPPRTPPLRD